MKRASGILLALLSSLLFFATAPPLGIWILAPIAWIPLLVAIRGRSVRAALAFGFVHGLSTNLLAFHWVGSALSRIESLSVFESGLGLVGLCGLQGLRSAVITGGWAWLSARRTWPLPIAAPIVVVLVEGAFPQVFPWSTANLVQGNAAWMQLAELAGCAGISYWLTLVSALATEAPLLRNLRAGGATVRWLGLAAGVCLLGTALGYLRLRGVDDSIRHSAPASLHVGVVQGNVGPVVGRRVDAVAVHRELSLALLEQTPDVDLIVWSETVVSSPVAEESLPRMHRDFLTRDRRSGLQAPRIGVPMLLGLVLQEDADPASFPLISNAAVLFGSTGVLSGMYRKQALVPFTETALLTGTEGWIAPVSNFRPGPLGQYLEFQGHRLGVSICYEDTKPDIVRDSVTNGRAEFLLNLTSDTWFAGTPGPALHLMLARFRAVENRRFLLQVSNDGVTALVDPAGRILWQLPEQQAATKVAEVAWLSGKTGYHVVGSWLVPFAAVLALAMCLWSPKRGLVGRKSD